MPGDALSTQRRMLAEMMPRCACGRFLSLAKPHGWFKHGEHGSEEGWVCASCLPGWTPTDSRGRGPEAGYCGVKNPAPTGLATASTIISNRGNGT